MDFRLISFPSPKENIAFDQVLFEQAEKGAGGEVLRFWESTQTFIVLGKTSLSQRELVMQNIERDGVSIVRRTSAGGVVVQAKGCLNFTLILSKALHPQLSTIPTSYAFILNKVICALKSVGVQALFYPPCDLALEGNRRKISGNAQRRGKKVILHHGTLLHQFDISLAERYLTLPLKMPAYRQGRTHQDFMANIGRQPHEMTKALVEVFKAQEGHHQAEDKERAALDTLLGLS